MDLGPVRTLLSDEFSTFDGRELGQLGDEEILHVHEGGTARAELVVARRTVARQLPAVTEGWSAGELDGPRAAVVAGTVETSNAAEELLASHGARLAPGELSKVAKAVLARLVLPGDPRPDDPLTRRFTVASSGIGGETFSAFSALWGAVGIVGPGGDRDGADGVGRVHGRSR